MSFIDNIKDVAAGVVAKSLGGAFSFAQVRSWGPAAKNRFALPPISSPHNCIPYLELPASLDLVHLCSAHVARDMGTVDIKLYKENVGGKDIEVTKHWTLDLIYGSKNDETYHGILERTSLHLQLAGNAFWLLSPYLKNAKPTKIEVISPKYIMPLVNEYGKVTGYRISFSMNFDNASSYVDVPVESVVHFKMASATNEVYGDPILMGCETKVNTEVARQTWQLAFFNNNARPETLIVYDGEMPNDDIVKRFMTIWRKTFGGENKNGLPGIIGGPIKDVKILSPNAKDMDYQNLAKMSLEDFCAYFGVPKVLLNYSDGINRANADAEENFYWNNTIKPLHSIIADTLTRKLLQLRGESNLYFDFDYSDVSAMQKSMKELADTANVYYGMGSSPKNIFEYLGITMNLTPGQENARTEPAPVAPVAPEDNDSDDTEDEEEDQSTE